VAVNDNTIFSMPLSRRGRFVTICGEGPRSASGAARTPARARPAWSSGISRAGAAADDVGVARAGDGAYAAALETK
jgi:hypothetical protein